MAYVGHEVAPDLLDAAGLSLVLSEDEHQPAPAHGTRQWRHPDGEVSGPPGLPEGLDLNLGVPDLTVAADLARQGEQLTHHEPVALHDPERAGRLARAQHPVLAVQHDGG